MNLRELIGIALIAAGLLIAVYVIFIRREPADSGAFLTPLAGFPEKVPDGAFFPGRRFYDRAFGFPVAITDRAHKNELLFANEQFNRLLDITDEKEYNRIGDLIPGIERIGATGSKVLINGREFLFFCSAVTFEGRDCSFYQFVELPQGYAVSGTSGAPDSPSALTASQKTVVGIIFIDDYYEVLDNMEDARQPMLISLIDRKINALCRQVGGIVKKFEKDKYILILTADKLEYLKQGKFEILEQVKQIDSGNKQPITLSLGIGIDGKTLAESMNYARMAIDLALGRGGDQAVIRDASKCYFYGGVEKELSKSARVRARVKAYALEELIDEAPNVLIMGHANPDMDCLGSAIGIAKIVMAHGKPCHIVLGEGIKNIKQMYERIIERDEYKEIFIKPEAALEDVKPGTLLVIVDVHRPSFLECLELAKCIKKVVVFDHHRKSAEFLENTVLTYHEPYASSTSELITEMLLYMKAPVNLSPVEADALLSGITVDTKNFMFKTSARTFEAAAFLKRNGADSIRVRILFQNDMEAYKAKAIAVNSAERYDDIMAISVCPANVENPSLTTAQSADELLNISGIQASFVVCGEDNVVLVSARSLGKINVQLIMEKLNGGGHQTAAGAQLIDATTDEAIAKLKQAIDEYMNEVKR